MAGTRQLADLFFESARKAPDAVALRYFDQAASAWQTISWADYEKRVRKLAGWLQQKGVGKGDRVAILSPNRPEWLIADLAILAVGAVSTPIYATSSAKDISYILEHSGAKALLCDESKRAAGATTTLPAIVVTFDADRADGVTTLKNVLESDAAPLAATVPVTEGDLATIIYTSGTTGLPKGVMHTHGTFMATVKPVKDVLDEGRVEPDRFFSFLPLSHVAERVLVEIGSVITGSEVAFARSVDTIVDDMNVYPPTILLCVPRLWERIHEKIQTGLKTASGVKKTVFKLARAAGGARIAADRIVKAHDAKPGAKIADALVGKKLKTKLGMHRVRLFLTGSAPTRPEILKFFGAFGVFIREVYGLTENLCLGFFTGADEIVIGSCGRLFPGGTARIAADGEIQLKAPWNFIGYYKDEQATREAITPDGWFATGDLGALDADGRLRITGRKKELLKTSTGKYVAPVPIEDALKQLPVVTDAMMVGDNQKYCVALVAVDLAAVDGRTVEDLLKSHLEEVNRHLAHHESIKKIGILKDGFTIENGTLTPTLKLKRKVALTRYEGFITKVYGSTELIVRE